MSETVTAAASLMADARAAAPELPLVEYFERFYERVVRMKRALVSTEEETSVESAEIAQQELLAVLGQQSAEIRGEFGSTAVAILEQAHYVMAALADETFIHMNWSGREMWRDRLLLEAALFGTYRAGDEIFRRIDEVITGRIQNAYEQATIMLMALGLGFEGKYRLVLNGGEKLALHRKRLMAFISHRRPELDDPNRRLMPEAYSHTADQDIPEEIPDPRRWIWGLAIVLLGWLLIGHYLWHGVIADLKPILGQIAP